MEGRSFLSGLQGAVSDASEDVTWNRVSTPGNITMRIGTEAQVGVMKQTTGHLSSGSTTC